MQKIFKKMFSFVVAILVLTLLPFSVLADVSSTPTQPSGTTLAYVRIESSAPGQEKTLLPRTEVTFDDMEKHTALEVLAKATGGEQTIENSEYGAFITSIYGLSDETGQMSWMYALNNELIWDSVDTCEVQYRDELVFYFIDWQEAQYTYFTPSSLTAVSGKPFELTLTGNHFSEGVAPVADAEILITPIVGENENVAMPLNIHYTDADGKVELAFYAPATYLISARKSVPDGASVISRPLCEVTVVSAESTTIQFELDIPSTTGDIIFTPGEVTVEPAPAWPEPTISVMPVITYNAETGVFWTNGQPVALAEAFSSISENGTLLLPFRAVAESLGATVTWESETSTAHAHLEDKEVCFSMTDELNGTPVKVVDGCAYVPAAYLIAQFGLSSR